MQHDDGSKILHFPQEPGNALRFYFSLAVVAVLLVWFIWGGPLYSVDQDEQALVLTLGVYSGTTDPGLHFKWPWPIQTVITEKVTHVRQLEIGFRTLRPGMQGEKGDYQEFHNNAEMLKEATMLTGDTNIVLAEAVIQYSIADLRAYVFNVDRPDLTLRYLAESVLRQVVGDYGIDDALIRSRVGMEADIQKTLTAQVERYGLGIIVSGVRLQQVVPPMEVAPAFKDVATASEDKQKSVNEADGIRAEKVQQAEGEAQAKLLHAEGTRTERVNLAKGEADRFLKLLAEYKKAPDITRERLYQETLQRVMPRVRKVFVDPTAGVLNINKLEGLAVPAAAQEGGR